MKKFRKLPMIVSILLIIQLFFPIIGVFAAVLQAPTNLKAYQNYPGSVTLEWDLVSSSNVYKVYRVTGDTKTLEDQVTGNQSYLNLKEGTYSFAVSLVKSGQESPLSNSVTIEVKYPEMQAPSNLQKSVENYYDLTLSWSNAKYTHYYKIYQVTDGIRKLVKTTDRTSMTFTTLPEGHYQYEVTSYNSIFGESTQGAQVAVDIIYPEMKPPTNLTYSITNGNDVSLSWERSNYANKYNIYKIEDNKKKLVTSTNYLNISFSNSLEGKQIFEVTSFSYTYGESKIASRIEFDIINPEMQAPGSLNLSITNGNDGTLSWGQVNYVNFYNVYQILEGSRVLLKQTTNNQLPFINMKEGNYIFEVTSYSDRFGESSSAKLEQQVIYPEMKKPEDFIGNITNVNNLQLNWKLVDYAKSYNLYELVNGERHFVSKIENSYTTIKDLKEGKYIYEITSYSDRFGESKEAASIEVAITLPTIQAPKNLEFFVNQEMNSIALWWEDVEFASSYDIYQVLNGERIFIQNTPNTRIVLSNMHEGKYTYEVLAHSKYGDSPPSNQVTATVDPELTAPTKPEASIKGDDVTLSWDPVNGADSYNVYKEVDGERVLVENTREPNLTLEDLPTGDYTFIIVPVSESGKESSSSTTVTLGEKEFDTTAPVTVSNVSKEWYQGDVTIELTATDDLSGVAKTFYSVNGSEFVEGTTFFVSNQGFNKVSFYSVDNAGNIENTKTIDVKIDKTAPETISNVIAKWYQGALAVSLTATDDLSGVAKTFYSVNGSEFEEGTTFTVSDERINKVSFYSVDKAGNIENAKTVEVKIDKSAPETVSNATDKWYQEEVALILTATDALSGVAKTFYSVNDSGYVEGTTFIVSNEGINKVSFYSVDKAGNIENEKTIEVKIDKTAPETVSNVTDKWYQGEVSVILTATDALSGVAKTFYSVNGSEFIEGTTFIVSDEGIKKVSFYSVDNAGNVENMKTVEVKIDKTAPESETNVSEKWNQGDVTVKLTATDYQSGVAKTFYSVNGSDFVEGTTFNVSKEGINNVTFYSVDNAGNVEKVKSVEVKIDKTAPVVSSKFANEYALGTSIPLTYEASDELSGIGKEIITVNGKEYKKGDTLKLDQPGTYKVVITVSDQADWSTTLEKSFVNYIAANLVVTPGVIKQNSGEFTVRVTLPNGFATDKIDLNTATLNGVAAKKGTNGLVQQAKNGQFKFNRDDFNWSKGMVKVEFRVMLDGILVVGSTIVEVK
jgi:large repetitive protein